MKNLKYVGLLGRLIFAAVFVQFGMGHFNSGTIHWAASVGVPMAGFLVPFSGVMCIAGALSIALGFKPRWGAALLVLFLVPVTLKIHKFWGLSDENKAGENQVHFMKNAALVGLALLVMETGTGGCSLKD